MCFLAAGLVGGTITGQLKLGIVFGMIITLISGHLCYKMAFRIATLNKALQAIRNKKDQNRRLTPGRPFILYLRSFAIDQKEPDDLMSSMFFGMGHALAGTEEEKLVKEIRQRVRIKGRKPQVLAVGRPDEVLPVMGAIRYTFSNDTWQAEVSRLMEQAAAIILVPGITDAVVWEFHKLVEHAAPGRVFIWGTTEATYAKWRQKAQTAFLHPLPEQMPTILTFDKEWKPISLKIGLFEVFSIVLQKQLKKLESKGGIFLTIMELPRYAICLWVFVLVLIMIRVMGMLGFWD